MMMRPAQKQSITGIILESLTASAYQMMCFQRTGTIAVIDGTLAGGVDLLAPYCKCCHGIGRPQVGHLAVSAGSSAGGS